MKQTSELLESGMYEVITPEKGMTVAELLNDLKIEKPFGILINGKKGVLTHILKESDDVVILPNIAGG